MNGFEDDKKNDNGPINKGDEYDELPPATKKLILWRRSPEWLPSGLRAETLRLGVQKLIEQSAPYACMLTVNFAHPYADNFLLDCMNRIIKKLNRELFRRGFGNRQERLDGIVSVETCRDGGVLNNCLHFHILIKPCSALSSDNAGEILSPLVVKIVGRILDEKCRPISNEELVKVSPYTGIGTLPTYLTKEFEYRGSEAVGFIGFLSFHGIEGLNIPAHRKKNDLIRDSTR